MTLAILRRGGVVAAIAGALVLASAAESRAVISRAGGAAGDFLLLGIGARPAGMGDAFIGVRGDPACLFWNPAGLPEVDKFSLEISHNQWLLGMRHDYLGFTAPMEHFVKDLWGTAGISYTSLSSGEETRTLEDGDGNFAGIGNPKYFTAGSTVLGLGYGGHMTQVFSVGGNLKLVSQKIDEKSDISVALDLAILTRFSLEGFSAGVVIMNIGPKFAGAWMPLTGKAGGAYEIKEAPVENTVLTLTGDVWLGFLTGDTASKANFGAEYKLLFGTVSGHGRAAKGPPHEVSLRAGYRFNHYWYTALDGLSVGGGLMVTIAKNQYGIDYAVSPHGTLEGTAVATANELRGGVSHRISLQGRF